MVAGWAIPALAAAGPSPRATVRVEIDVSKVEEFDAGGIEKDVRARTEHIVDEQGYFLDDAAPDAIVVRVEYIDKQNLEYGIHFDVLNDGKLVQPGEQRVVCKYCNHSMIADKVAERLPGALERLAKSNAGDDAEPVVDEPADDGTLAVEDDGGKQPGGTERDVGRRAPRSLVLRNAGLGVLIPGGVALGVGAGLALAGTREVEPERPGELLERDYRPPGIAVAVIGAVATSVGVGLLIAHAVRNRGGKSSAPERLTVSPLLGEQAGVVLRGRF